MIVGVALTALLAYLVAVKVRGDRTGRIWPVVAFAAGVVVAGGFSRVVLEIISFWAYPDDRTFEMFWWQDHLVVAWHASLFASALSALFGTWRRSSNEPPENRPEPNS